MSSLSSNMLSKETTTFSSTGFDAGNRGSLFPDGATAGCFAFHSRCLTALFSPITCTSSDRTEEEATFKGEAVDEVAWEDGTAEEVVWEDGTVEKATLEDGTVAEAVCKAWDGVTVEEAVGSSWPGVTNVTCSATLTGDASLAEGGWEEGR